MARKKKATTAPRCALCSQFSYNCECKAGPYEVIGKGKNARLVPVPKPPSPPRFVGVTFGNGCLYLLDDKGEVLGLAASGDVERLVIEGGNFRWARLKA